MDLRPLYTFLITVYECNGKGVEFTLQNVRSIIDQSYRPIQIVVSDHSRNDLIEIALKGLDWKGIEYVYDRYKEHYGNPCHNWNNALRFSKGDYIQYFAMDDYLATRDTIKEIVTFMEKTPESKWFVMPSLTHSRKERFIPRWNEEILSVNTLGGPSGSVIRKAVSHVTLDPRFTWFLDTDWYYRLYLECGKPHITEVIGWVNRVHRDSLSKTVFSNRVTRGMEMVVLKHKYGDPLPKSP
jgi:hypothetical protein